VEEGPGGVIPRRTIDLDEREIESIIAREYGEVQLVLKGQRGRFWYSINREPEYVVGGQGTWYRTRLRRGQDSCLGYGEGSRKYIRVTTC